MSDWNLLRAMVLKEFRTAFRERTQMRALVVSVVLMCVVISGTMVQVGHHVHDYPSTRMGTRPAPSAMDVPAPTPPLNHEELTALRWLAIGVASVVGFIFSMGYLLAAVLASFVGEKEARTLEILLVAPISDRKLFAAKSLAVLFPSVVLGYALAVAVSILACTLLPRDLIHLPWDVLPYALVLSLPIMVLPQIWFVGLGAAISAKAETMKGAGQILSVAFMVLVFGSVYGLRLLFTLVPALGPPMASVVAFWIQLPFAAQYLLVLLVLAIPAIVCMTVGRLCFRRDRMLA